LSKTDNTPLIGGGHVVLVSEINDNEPEGAGTQENFGTTKGFLAAPCKDDGEGGKINAVVRRIRWIKDVGMCRNPCNGLSALVCVAY